MYFFISLQTKQNYSTVTVCRTQYSVLLVNDNYGTIIYIQGGPN